MMINKFGSVISSHFRMSPFYLISSQAGAEVEGLTDGPTGF